MSYNTFLESKIVVNDEIGVDIDAEELHSSTFPHERDATIWALRNGRALVAMSFGLGKTHIQCEIARLLHERTDKSFLVVCPLGVKHQFTEEDGPRLGVDWQYVRTDAEVEACESPYLITNYERVRDGKIDPRKHDIIGVSLDEGSVLRSLGNKTSTVFEEIFADTPYRFVCTATPAPNEYREIIYYARFLGIMDTGQALTRWFKRDPNKAGNLKIHPQHEEEFWLWVASWALFVYRPSDLGYSDEGYELPEMRVHWHRISVDHSRAFQFTDNRGQHKLLLDPTSSVSEAAQEKRATLPDRIVRLQEILATEPDEHWIIWHQLEDERRAIEKAIPEAVSIYGSLKDELKEERVIDFAHGRIQLLATKPQLNGFGCNLQRHCSRNVFLGISYKFEEFIQAIHRTYRFQQDQPVDVHIIYAESEEKIVRTLKRKWGQYDKLTTRMQEIVSEYGLSHAALRGGLKRNIGIGREEEQGDFFTAILNDCVLEMPNIESDSVGLIHTSIPFGDHYEYTTTYNDFGHNHGNARFWEQMDYLIPELLRVLKPGRLAAIHVKDRVLYGYQTGSGFMEIAPFSDECVMAFRKHGWLYEGRRTIVTDVVRENNSTYRLGWTEMSKDASKMGSGLPEYLLLFRKAPTSTDTQRGDEPIVKSKIDYTRGRWQIDAHSFWQSDGDSLMIMDPPYDYEAHVVRLEEMDEKGHLPASYFYEPPVSRSPWVWDDIAFMQCLNSQQARRKERNHICPLPLDVVKRTIRLYSNPDDVVFDPFAGLFTVPYVAVQMGRYGVGIELSDRYYDAGVGFCRDAERQRKTPTLFDWVEQQQGNGKGEPSDIIAAPILQEKIVNA